jgi:hypothetical protein
VPLLCNHAIFDPQQYGSSMCLPASTFPTTIQKVANQIFVQLMDATEFRNAHPLTIKRSAGLLRCNWRVHSAFTPVDMSCFVFIGGDYAR